MATVLIAFGLAVLIMAFIAYPLFRRATPWTGEVAEEENPLGDLLTQRDATYMAIKDLDLDYAMGKLSEEDYRSLRAQYTAQGVSILQALDQQAEARVEADLEAEIEEAVRRLRRAEVAQPTPQPQAVAVPPEEALEAEIEREVHRIRQARAAPGPRMACPRCGHTYRIEDKFCAHCGASLARLCPNCGAPYDEGDRFCASCGHKIANAL
ncbi:MAG: zinc-ribbon domain-containing protein [Anaerolineae bacterium]